MPIPKLEVIHIIVMWDVGTKEVKKITHHNKNIIHPKNKSTHSF